MFMSFCVFVDQPLAVITVMLFVHRNKRCGTKTRCFSYLLAPVYRIGAVGQDLGCRMLDRKMAGPEMLIVTIIM